MRVHARRHQDSDQISLEEVPLTFALDVTPVPDRCLFLKIAFLDLQGKPVTADTVSVDLIHDPDGNLVISAVRLDATKPHGQLTRPWQAKFWKTRIRPYMMSEHACTSSPGETCRKGTARIGVCSVPVIRVDANNTRISTTRGQSKDPQDFGEEFSTRKLSRVWGLEKRLKATRQHRHWNDG